MVHILQRPLNPRIAATRILCGHPHRETPPLPIVQVQPASGDCAFSVLILLAKERDFITLLAVEPSEQRDEEHL